MAKEITIRDMIAHAKDRLIDDLREWLKEHDEYFASILPADRAQLQRMITLLSLPDEDPATLAALSFSYWNGAHDSFWETHVMPKGFLGFRYLERD